MTDLENEELSDENKSDNQEESNENKQDSEKSGPGDELLQLKKDFAKEYFEKIYLDNGGLPGFLLAETGTVEDYMTSEGIMDKVKDKIILRMLLEKVLEKETVDKLDDMKNKIEIVSTKEGLEELKKSVGMISSSAVNTASNNTSQQSVENNDVVIQEEQKVDQYIKDVSADTEKYSSKKEKLLVILDKIIQYDKANPVKYNRGKRASLKEGLDCSGLVIYALHQIGLKEIGANSRDMFPKLPTQKITQESGGSISDNVNIKQGDLLFRDSQDPNKTLNKKSIPQIKKDGKTYRINHVAFVKDVDKSSGEITIVESNGTNGVVERKISPEQQRKEKKQDLYVGSVDYDKLLAYKGKNENIDNVA